MVRANIITANNIETLLGCTYYPWSWLRDQNQVQNTQNRVNPLNCMSDNEHSMLKEFLSMYTYWEIEYLNVKIFIKKCDTYLCASGNIFVKSQKSLGFYSI